MRGFVLFWVLKLTTGQENSEKSEQGKPNVDSRISSFTVILNVKSVILSLKINYENSS